MWIKWFLVFVYFMQELLAEKVQLYGVDVDSIIDELHNYKNQLRGQSQADVDDLNYDDLVSLLEEASRSNDAVDPKLDEEAANKEALNRIFNYHSQPETRHEHVKNSKQNDYNDLQRLLKLVNKSNKLQANSVELEEESLNKPKIYVLDMENLRNIETLNDVVNSLSNTKKNQRKEKVKNKYKGFVVRDIRRASRDSKEAYAGKDSLESDYKPAKRPRDHFAGRTAIPYVKNRGDIYERDEKYK